MNMTHAPQTTRDQHTASASDQTTQQSDTAASYFVDNRPEAIIQRKLVDAINHSPYMVAQRQRINGMFGSAVQLKETVVKPNHTGLPDNLKSSIESLSGISLDHVKTHYNSSHPASLNA